jgi:diguanylate cyclase (GGDEF)-like protein/PAS domain S-box-containing protein
MTLVRLLIVVFLLQFAGMAGATDTGTTTLVVGSEQDYPPFAVGQTDETAGGFTVELWKVVAHETGLQYTLRVKPFHQLLEEFKQGKIDVLINLAQSDERRKFADFTVPHVTVHGAIFIRDDTPGIRNEQDLTGKSVIVVNADIAHEYAISKDWGKNLTLVPTATDGLRLLASGQHDAMFVSKLVGMQTLEQLKLSKITALPVTVGANQKFSFAVRKGNADLLALLNEGLALSKSSGAYDVLYQNWFSVYEGKKEPTLRDMLRYLLPLLAVFLGYVFLTYYRRHKESGEAMQLLAESHHMLQTVIDTLPMRVFWKDQESRFLGCNTLFAKDAGEFDPGGVIGKLDTQFAWKDQAGLYQMDDQQVMASGQAKLAFDEPQTTPDGNLIWLRTYKVPLRSMDQKVIGVLGVYNDITEAKETERALMESESRLAEILENVSAFIYLKDSAGRYLFANKLVRELWHASTEEIIGFGDEKFFDAKTTANIRKNDRRVLQDGETIRAEETNLVTQTGTIATYWSVKLPLRRENGEIYALCGISTDVSEVKRAQEEMRLAAMVYENSSEAMMVTDADGSIVAINPAFTKTTGYPLEEVKGKNPSILNSHHHAPAFFQDMWRALNTTGCWQGEIWDKRKDGEVYPKWMTINTTFNADGTPCRRIALFSDITEKKKSEQIIWQQANFDVLTGLPNRRMFHDRLDQEIKKGHRSHHHLALLFIDLDHFKAVNDTLGHNNGDLLLTEAAQRLQNCVRESDTVARLGGDEFTIILGELDDTRGVDRIAQAILKSMAAPFILGGETAYVSASIGITLYPEDATVIETLVKNADQAMYAAKHQGRNRCSYFTQAMDQAAQSRMRLSNDLRIALPENQFWIAYQPIVELATGAIHKAEALLRWQHPTRGLISPAEFIPVAEETGAIIDIGNWVFQQAASQVARWREHDPDFQISVNKSPVQFLDNGANSKGWLDIMQDMNLPWKSIVIEITEGLLLDADPIVDSRLIQFRNKGMQVAIDDFGTGYSSLAYLKKFDIDYLKIDQSFVRNLAHGTKDLALCEAIIVMSHKLGIHVIAEGVETSEQRDLLMATGCDYAQGYFFSRPLAAAEFEKLLGPLRPLAHVLQ